MTLATSQDPVVKIDIEPRSWYPFTVYVKQFVNGSQINYYRYSKIRSFSTLSEAKKYAEQFKDQQFPIYL